MTYNKRTGKRRIGLDVRGPKLTSRQTDCRYSGAGHPAPSSQVEGPIREMALPYRVHNHASKHYHASWCEAFEPPAWRFDRLDITPSRSSRPLRRFPAVAASDPPTWETPARRASRCTADCTPCNRAPHSESQQAELECRGWATTCPSDDTPEPITPETTTRQARASSGKHPACPLMRVTRESGHPGRSHHRVRAASATHLIRTDARILSRSGSGRCGYAASVLP